MASDRELESARAQSASLSSQLQALQAELNALRSSSSSSSSSSSAGRRVTSMPAVAEREGEGEPEDVAMSDEGQDNKENESQPPLVVSQASVSKARRSTPAAVPAAAAAKKKSHRQTEPVVLPAAAPAPAPAPASAAAPAAAASRRSSVAAPSAAASKEDSDSEPAADGESGDVPDPNSQTIMQLKSWYESEVRDVTDCVVVPHHLHCSCICRLTRLDVTLPSVNKTKAFYVDLVYANDPAFKGKPKPAAAPAKKKRAK